MSAESLWVRPWQHMKNTAQQHSDAAVADTLSVLNAGSMLMDDVGGIEQGHAIAADKSDAAQFERHWHCAQGFGSTH